jgi:ankyrin repeat protein
MAYHNCIGSKNLACFKYLLLETEKAMRAKTFKFKRSPVEMPGFDGLSPLMMSVIQDSPKIFAYLIESDADYITVKDREENTILHLLL